MAWKDLNSTGAVDRSSTDQEAIDRLRQRLAGKGTKKYPNKVRKSLALLIDANPIENASQFFADIGGSLKPDARAVGYKAVWIVGWLASLESIEPTARASKGEAGYGTAGSIFIVQEDAPWPGAAYCICPTAFEVASSDFRYFSFFCGSARSRTL